MKQTETIFRKERFFAVVMVLCFLYGGYSILSFGFQGYASFTRPDLPFNGKDANFLDRNNGEFPDANFFRDIRQRGPRNRLEFIYAPLSLSYLFGGIVSLLAGISILAMLREKEHKDIKRKMAGELLLPDEKKLIEALKKAGSEMTQSKLAMETGLSKVQVHRAVKRLESKGVIEKHRYGLTNKIVLKKGLFE